MQVYFDDYILGAGLATDLVNTAPEVLGSDEALDSPATLKAFLEARDLAGGRITAADLSSVHGYRQELRRLLELPGTGELVGSLNASLTGRELRPALRRDDAGRWQWYAELPARVRALDSLAIPIEIGLLAVVRTLGHERVRDCASPTCHGMFVDTSRAGRRRFCMPDVCGNRVNVANYRARRKSAGRG